MSLDQEMRIRYVREVWSEFQRKAETQRPMSNHEWCVAREWATKDYPLRVVLRAMQDFNGIPHRLEALEEPVRRSVEYWRASLS